MLSLHVSPDKCLSVDEVRHLVSISRHQGSRQVVDRESTTTTMAGIQDKKKFRSWTLNFNRRPTERQELASPPGFASSVAVSHAEEKRETDPSLVTKVSRLSSSRVTLSPLTSSLASQRSWEIALAPMKQIPMNMFLMYMAGNSVSIFPIMMVGMLFMRPIKALLTLSATFKVIEGDQSLFQKFVFLLGNVGCIALALYKCQSMGLLPTHPSDWLEFLQPPQRLEYAGGGILFS